MVAVCRAVSGQDHSLSVVVHACADERGDLVAAPGGQLSVGRSVGVAPTDRGRADLGEAIDEVVGC
jgi:hypothetical protein